MKHTDLIIIGAGPGGYRAAEYAAKSGLQVTLFEADAVGGTCLNRGCIPTKTLARHAELMDELRDADTFGLADLHYTFRFEQVMARKEQVVSQLRSGVEHLLSTAGVTLVQSRAAFSDAHTIVADGEEYTAPHIIIATGAAPKRLPFAGAHVVTSDELLHLSHLPQRISIIGAGVIGMEFASILCAFGCDVTVLEYLDECLPMVDADIAKRLRTQLKRRGVTFHVGAAVKDVTAESVVFERKGKEQSVEADLVVMATGRQAHTEGLQLEHAGVEVSRTGIVTNAHFQTSVPHIYAIGDVNGRLQLAHAATAQGLYVVDHLLGRPSSCRLDIIPAAVFTHPELAFVGAKSERTARVNYRSNGKALAMNEGDGVLDLYVDANNLLTGCTALGTHAADLVQEVSALMAKGTTAHELATMVHIHPTVSELLVDAAMSL